MNAKDNVAAAEKKRLLIVTWAGSINYGTDFQAFALQRVLESYGYDVRVLDCEPIDPYSNNLRDRVKLILSFLGLLGPAYTLNKLFRLSSPKRRKFYAFAKENRKKFEKAYTTRKLKKIAKETDVFISGSDQIWNSGIFNPFNFLSFAKGKKRISYASSIGGIAISDEHKGEIKDLLLEYQHIGVREETAVRVLSELTGRTDIVQVLDPTFLLTKDDWLQVAEGASLEFELPQHYIFAYLLGEDLSWCRGMIEDVVAKTGIKDIMLVQANYKHDIKDFIDGTLVCKDAGPKDFLRLLSACDIVCTNSFHGTALSINFKKPFVEFARFSESDLASRNPRVHDLLSHYGLISQLYAEGSDDWLCLFNEARTSVDMGGAIYRNRGSFERRQRTLAPLLNRRNRELIRETPSASHHKTASRQTACRRQANPRPQGEQVPPRKDATRRLRQGRRRRFSCGACALQRVP